MSSYSQTQFSASVVLASGSVQREALLRQIGIEPLCVPADIDESLLAGESAADYVQRLAREKSQVVADKYPDSIVIGADTTILIGDQVVMKAENLEHSKEILSLLSGTRHRVLTGVAVIASGELRETVVTTLVDFRTITMDEIIAYWSTGEPQGKAGSYAIQGLGGIFVNKIEGSYSNVVGLPLHEVASLLQDFGYSLFDGIVVS